VELMPTIKSGLFELPAILTLPKAGEKFPLVILVHGSGPNDKDETILNNKPFKDIALGLAEKGIATLRYDKRTKVYPQAFIQNTKFTVDEEVIQDVMSAIDLAKKFNEIDTNRIYILGHSLGGMLAPRIGKGAKSLAGIIILAGNSRPLEQLVEDQYTYLFGLDKGVNHTKELKSISSQCARISNGQFDVNTPGAELPLGIPGAYWKDLTLYNQVETAKLLTIPLLILQGESDYQVTMKDFEGWKPAMHQTKSVMISYPHLNHIFCPISRDGLSTPTDYQHPCNVESKVIEDITHWINTK